MKVAISSGHAKHVAGAVGPSPWGLNEVDEARRIVNQVANLLSLHDDVNVVTFHDNTSKNQSDNLDAIVAWHKEQDADVNVSVHLNAFEPTAAGRGTEVCYRDEADLAREMSAAIASCGFTDRGPKLREDLKFLNSLPDAILIETCFVDSETDCRVYQEMFNEVCDQITCVLSDGAIEQRPAPDDYPAVTTPERPEITISIDAPDDVELIVRINGVNVA